MPPQLYERGTPVFVVTEFLDGGTPPRIDDLEGDGEAYDVQFQRLSFRRGFGKLYVDHFDATDTVAVLRGTFGETAEIPYGRGFRVTVLRTRVEAEAYVASLVSAPARVSLCYCRQLDLTAEILTLVDAVPTTWRGGRFTFDASRHEVRVENVSPGKIAVDADFDQSTRVSGIGEFVLPTDPLPEAWASRTVWPLERVARGSNLVTADHGVVLFVCKGALPAGRLAQSLGVDLLNFHLTGEINRVNPHPRSPTDTDPPDADPADLTVGDVRFVNATAAHA